MRTPSAFVCRPICIEKHWVPLASGLIWIRWDPMGSHGVQVGFKEDSCGPPPLSCAHPYA